MNDETLLDQLPPPYAAAARQVIAEFAARPEVLAILLAGSVIRGEGGPNSDLDFWIFADLPYRQRRSLLMGEVPVEILLNPPARFARSLEAEDGHAVHMIGYGWPVYVRDDATPQMADFQAKARAAFERGPRPWGAGSVDRARYAAIDTLLDVEDVLDVDAPSATLLMNRALDTLLDLYYGRAGVWLPKGKRLLKDLAIRDPNLGTAVRAYLVADTAAARHSALRAVFAGILPEGFGLAAWCWESERDPVPE